MLISIETHIAFDFPGGSGPPNPPLWIRTCIKQICVLQCHGHVMVPPFFFTIIFFYHGILQRNYSKMTM